MFDATSSPLCYVHQPATEYESKLAPWQHLAALFANIFFMIARAHAASSCCTDLAVSRLATCRLHEDGKNARQAGVPPCTERSPSRNNSRFTQMFHALYTSHQVHGETRTPAALLDWCRIRIANSKCRAKDKNSMHLPGHETCQTHAFTRAPSLMATPGNIWKKNPHAAIIPMVHWEEKAGALKLLLWAIKKSEGDVG